MTIKQILAGLGLVGATALPVLALAPAAGAQETDEAPAAVDCSYLVGTNLTPFDGDFSTVLNTPEGCPARVVTLIVNEVVNGSRAGSAESMVEGAQVALFTDDQVVNPVPAPGTPFDPAGRIKAIFGGCGSHQLQIDYLDAAGTVLTDEFEEVDYGTCATAPTPTTVPEQPQPLQPAADTPADHVEVVAQPTPASPAIETAVATSSTPVIVAEGSPAPAGTLPVTGGNLNLVAAGLGVIAIGWPLVRLTRSHPSVARRAS